MAQKKLLVIFFLGVVLTGLLWFFHGHKPGGVKRAFKEEFHLDRLHFQAGEYLLRVRDEHVDEMDQILSDHHLVLKFPLIFGWALVVDETPTLQGEQNTFQVLGRLQQDPRVSVASLNHEVESAGDEDWIDAADMVTDETPVVVAPRPGAVTSDPFFVKQWNLQAPSATQPGAMDIEGAWRITHGSPNVVVAVVEDGFALQHPDFKGPSACSRRFLSSAGPLPSESGAPPSPHGTYVLGILAACTNNGVGISGIDWHARVLALKRGKTTSKILLSMLWAIGFDPCKESLFRCPAGVSFPPNPNPADILNLSFIVPSEKLAAHLDQFLVRDLWQEVMQVAAQKNVIVVAAAGNESQVLTPLLHAPAGAEGVIAVGSVDRNAISPHNSRFGPDVDILAPGVQIWTTDTQSEGYAPERGTSFATPQVAGVVSLMKSVYPELNWKSARRFMEMSASSLKCEQYCGEKSNGEVCRSMCCDPFGQSTCPGLVNAARAVELAKACQEGEKGGPCVKVGGQRLPKAALLDVDQYVLFTKNDLQPLPLRLTNRGGDDTWVNMRMSEPHVQVGFASGAPVKKLFLRAGTSVNLQVRSREKSAHPKGATLTFEAYAKDSSFARQKPPLDRITTTIRYKASGQAQLLR